MKRFLLSFMLLLFALILSFAGTLYFVDINDHRQWLSEQIEKSTGYQVRFNLIENHYWQESRFSLSGVSLLLDKKELLQIDKIDLVISELDFWHRQLTVDLIELTGVALNLEEQAINKQFPVQQQQKDKIAKLPWARLQLNKLRLIDFNADISYGPQKIQLQHAAVNSGNLTLIEDNKFVAERLKGELDLDVGAFTVQLAAQKTLKGSDFSLTNHFDLANLQITLYMVIGQLELLMENYPPVMLSNSLLESHLDKNRLSITRLFFNAFSGELDLQADALFSIDLLAHPSIITTDLTVQSLLLKDMQLTIPKLPFEFLPKSDNNEVEQTSKKQQWPLKSLLLKDISMDNISLSSERPQIPLTVKGFNGQLADLYLIENHQLVDLSKEKINSGRFSLQFSSLQWADSITEQFSASGRFLEGQQQISRLITEK